MDWDGMNETEKRCIIFILGITVSVCGSVHMFIHSICMFACA